MIAYFDCFSGIAGDMTVAALLDAGLDWYDLCSMMSRVIPDSYEAGLELVTRKGLKAKKFNVITDSMLPTRHRHLADIVEIISEAGLPEDVRDNAISIFRKLGAAEAHVHGVPVDSIHFHEVGAVDSIVDIVSACIGFHLMGITRIMASPLPVGRGMVRTAHGLMPVPAPATAELCKGIPTYAVDVEGELVTPTGAAILATLAEGFGPPPPMTTSAVGYGAGSKEFGERPNLLRVILGEAAGVSGFLTESLVLLETNIDDMNPQVYDDVMVRCFEAGALDVTLTPIHMKKNRPGVTISVLCGERGKEALAGLLMRHTTTLGIRISPVERISLPREIVTVETPYGEVQVKVAHHPDGFVKAHAEYDSARDRAKAAGATLMQVMAAAEEAYRSNQ